MAVRGEEVASSIDAHVREAIEKMVGEIRSSIEDVRDVVDSQLKAALESVQADVNGLSSLHHLQKTIGELEESITASAPAAAPLAPAVSPSGEASRVKQALQYVEKGKSQVDVLNALLEQCLEFGSRAALLILRGETFSGWKGVGFSKHGGNDEMVKRFNAAPGLIPELDQVLREERVLILDRENLSTPPARRPPRPPPRPSPRPRPPVEPPEASSPAAFTATQRRDMIQSARPSFNVPTAEDFGSTTATGPPRGRPAPAPPAPPGAPGEEKPSTQYIPPAGIRGAAGGTAPNEDAKKHDEARRFARLLVSEIKLYNESKVDQGRKNKDLYERLKEDIDRSRQMYDERIGEEVRKSSNYFYDELVRILADGNPGTLRL